MTKTKQVDDEVFSSLDCKSLEDLFDGKILASSQAYVASSCCGASQTTQRTSKPRGAKSRTLRNSQELMKRVQYSADPDGPINLTIKQATV